MKKKFVFSFLLIILVILFYSGCILGPNIPIAPEGFVYVKGGTFSMGNTRGDPEGKVDELPVHQVTLNYDFFMSKYEVTYSKFLEFVIGANINTDGTKDGRLIFNISHPDCKLKYDGTFYIISGYENKPMQYVSWWGTLYYCNWLSTKEGLQVAYDLGCGTLINYPTNTGYRIPTEAEWEYAARGGQKDITGGVEENDYKYSGGNDLNLVGWNFDNSTFILHEVGLKQPNELGIYDMSGNLWEWCFDRFQTDYYSVSPVVNPTGGTGSDRNFRGGSYYETFRCRVAQRWQRDPELCFLDVGFRVCRTTE